jgi:hypothetical protein
VAHFEEPWVTVMVTEVLVVSPSLVLHLTNA